MEDLRHLRGWEESPCDQVECEREGGKKSGGGTGPAPLRRGWGRGEVPILRGPLMARGSVRKERNFGGSGDWRGM